MPVEQARNAAQTDTELLSYLLSRRARPIEIDHGLEILGDKRSRRLHQRVVLHTSFSVLRVRFVVPSGLLKQDHRCSLEPFSKVRAVRVSYQQVHSRRVVDLYS